MTDTATITNEMDHLDQLGAKAFDGYLARADSKSQQASGWGCRRTIASNAVMSCITACKPARIERNPASRSRFKAAVRSVAITLAPLPR